MKRKQSGVSLSGLLVWSVILAVVALLGMKVGPEYQEYFQIVKTVKKISNDPSAQTSVAQVVDAFDRAAVVDNIAAITGKDLEISKDGGVLVVSFSYERRIPLFKTVSLLLEFEGSSQE